MFDPVLYFANTLKVLTPGVKPVREFLKTAPAEGFTKSCCIVSAEVVPSGATSVFAVRLVLAFPHQALSNSYV